MSEYPKWKYHKSSDPIVCNTKDDEDALEKGWADSPREAKGLKKSEPPAGAAGELAKSLEKVTANLKDAELLVTDLQDQLGKAEDHIDALESTIDDLRQGLDLPADEDKEPFSQDHENGQDEEETAPNKNPETKKGFTPKGSKSKTAKK